MKTLISLIVAVLCVYNTSCGRKIVGYETIKTNKGYRGEAGRNPFLAAQLFLEEYNYLTSYSSRSEYDVDQYDALVIPAASVKTESQTKRMLDYMDDGGHVVLLLENGEREYRDFSNSFWRNGSVAFDQELIESLVDEFGVLILEGDETSYDDEDQKIMREEALRSYEVPNSRIVKINILEQQHEVKLGTSLQLVDDGTSSPMVHSVIKDQEVDFHKIISKGYGSHLGRLTLITDARMLRNPHLATQNHPSFLLDILNFSNANSVLFTYGVSESFYSLLAKYYLYGLIGLLSLVFFWLLYRGQRFGPIIGQLSSEPISYLKAIDSRGHFYWKNKKDAYLIRGMQNRAERVLGISSVTGEAKAERLKVVAAELEIKTDEIREALRECVVREPTSFIESVSILQKIIKNYE